MLGFGKALLPVAFKTIDQTKAISQKRVQLKSKSIRRTSACKLPPRIADRADSAEKEKEKAGNPERVTRPHTWTASHNEAVAFVASDCKARQNKKGAVTRAIARASHEVRVRLLRGVLPGEQHVVRLEPALHRAGVEAVGRIDHERVHLLLAQHRIERVRQLDLAAHAGLHVG